MIIFHPESGELRDGKKVRVTLPRRAASVLAALLRAPGGTLKKRELYAAVWGTRSQCYNILEASISKLRASLEAANVPVTIPCKGGICRLEGASGSLEILRPVCPRCGHVI